MTTPAVPGLGLTRAREQQLVRMDGTVLVSFVVPAGMRLAWNPEPETYIQSPCAGRIRELPDGPWIVLAYFPEGYPGPSAPFPEDMEIGGQASLPPPEVTGAGG